MKILTKQQAIKLRLQGKSYLDIQRELGTPKSTLSTWLRDVQVSDSARAKINKNGRAVAIAALLKRNKLQTKNAVARSVTMQKAASKQVGKIFKKENCS